VEEIMEKVYGLTIEYHYIRKNGRILGETIFVDAEVPIYERRNDEGYKLIRVKAGTVIIDAGLLHKRVGNEGRLRFTCAHELAHWVIDKDYFMEHGVMAAMTKDKRGKAIVSRSSETDVIVERQANRMASRILMPKCTLKQAFYQARKNTAEIATELSVLYGVSKQAMEIRLKELGLAL